MFHQVRFALFNSFTLDHSMEMTMKKTYSTPLVIASDVVRETMAGGPTNKTTEILHVSSLTLAAFGL
jgi:hypothetical protein